MLYKIYLIGETVQRKRTVLTTTVVRTPPRATLRHWGARENGVGELHPQCQAVVFCEEGLSALTGSRFGRKAVRMPMAGRNEQRW